MKNNLKYIFLSLIIILPSIFNCENFLFIRFFSLYTVILSIYIVKKYRIKEFNTFSLIIVLLYLISIAFYFNFSANSYNIRLHFAEYGTYGLLFIVLSSLNIDKRKMFIYFGNAIIISSFIQILYSLYNFFKGDYRIEGNTNYPNFLSLLLIVAFSVALLFFIQYLRKRSKWSVFYLSVLSILLFFSFQTGSRNIFILLPISLFTIFIFLRKKIMLIFLIVIIGLLLLIPSTAKNRLFNEGKINPYGVQRANIYKQVFNIALNNLPFGIGYNNLHYYTLKNNFSVEGRIARYGSYAKIAHNEYLEWFVNTGIIGLLIMIFIFFSFYKFLLSKINLYERWLFVVFCLFAGMSVIDNALYLPYNAIIFIFVIAFIFNKIYKRIKLNIIKYAVIIYVVMLSFILIADIVGEFYISHIREKIETMDMNKVDNNIILIKQLDYLYYLQGNPDIVKSRIHYNENLYILTKYVKYFQAMLDDYENLMNYTKMDYTVYRDYARLLLKYKNSVLRKNNNINEKIDYFYNQSIHYNPHNPFLRYEYAVFLINIDKKGKGIKQLKIAIEKEPYFLRGLVLLSKVNNNENIKQKMEYIKQNYNKLIKQTKTDYEKELLRL